MEMDSVIARQRISPRNKTVSAVRKARTGGDLPFPSPPRKRTRRVFKLPKLSFLRTKRPGSVPNLASSSKTSFKPRKGGWFVPDKKRAVVVAGIVLATVAFALSLGAVRGLEERARIPSSLALHEDASAVDMLTQFISPELQADMENDGGIDMPPLPVTLAVTTYTVRPGDALLAIAVKYHITLDALISMNGITDARKIYAGARLRVPNISGIVHTVARGESVGVVAARYGVSPTAILDANDLGSSTIRPGQVLFVPGARMSPTELKKALGQLVAWPLRGLLSSYFGYRPNPFTGMRSFHNGIDIVAPQGVAIKAAMDGRVADVGYNSLYGNYIILSHASGYQTLYGHLSRVLVKKGQSVAQGSVMGAVGTTGYSTGPHLHFSVFYKGSAMDPLKLLD